MTECTQAKPPRANVQTEIKNGILTVTFTMTPHVDLEFNIVDDATNEIVFWSEILYQDPATNHWWMFGLVDGSKRQYNLIRSRRRSPESDAYLGRRIRNEGVSVT